MKLTFKLSKDEAESFKNWSEVVKPEGIDENQFLKTIFFNGIEALNKQLSEIAEKEKDKIIAAQALQAQKDAANETQPPNFTLAYNLSLSIVLFISLTLSIVAPLLFTKMFLS